MAVNFNDKMVMIQLIKTITPDFIKKEFRKRQKLNKMKLYEGDKVYCPVCKSRFEIFASHGLVKGALKRENAKCVNCGSLERHRLLFLYLSNKTNLFDDKSKLRLLHFAPEKFFYEIFSQKQNIEYIPCDLFPERYVYKGKVPVQKIDISEIPFEENYFDVVLCNHVLEHIPDDIHAMTELYRVMKKGAWGIFHVPIDYNREKTYEDFAITTPEEREKAFGQDDHVRWYGKDYIERLKSVGFKVIEDDYVNSFSSDELYKLGLMSKHIIYYCEK